MMKGFMIIWVLMIVSFIADLVSTLMNGETMHYLETNPLYRLGGFWIIIALNLFMIWYSYFCYKRAKPFIRWNFIYLIVMLVAVRIFVIISNIQAGDIPLEQAMQISTAEKNAYFLSIWAKQVFPLLISVVTYVIFRMDHKIEILDN